MQTLWDFWDLISILHVSLALNEESRSGVLPEGSVYLWVWNTVLSDSISSVLSQARNTIRQFSPRSLEDPVEGLDEVHPAIS